MAQEAFLAVAAQCAIHASQPSETDFEIAIDRESDAAHA
jgi:hypothetical protein